MIWMLDTNILVYFTNRKPGFEKIARQVEPLLKRLKSLLENAYSRRSFLKDLRELYAT